MEFFVFGNHGGLTCEQSPFDPPSKILPIFVRGSKKLCSQGNGGQEWRVNSGWCYSEIIAFHTADRKNRSKFRVLIFINLLRKLLLVTELSNATRSGLFWRLCQQ